MKKCRWQKYIKGLKIYLPDLFKQDIDILIEDMIHSEMDIVLCLDGGEGTGKSRTGRVLGKYIAHKTGLKFSPSNVHVTIDDYITFSESGSKFQVNVLDESREALNKRRGMSKSVVRFTNWLSENRDKQQVHIIILPAVHDLDNYISIWRMSLLVHQTTFHVKDESSEVGYKMERGFFKVFENSKALQQCLFNKARHGYYAYPHYAKYQGKFKDNEVFTKEELKAYKDKKAQKRKEKYEEMEKESKPMVSAEDTYIMMLKAQKKTDSQIGELFGLERSTISRRVRLTKDMIEKSKKMRAESL